MRVAQYSSSFRAISYRKISHCDSCEFRTYPSIAPNAISLLHLWSRGDPEFLEAGLTVARKTIEQLFDDLTGDPISEGTGSTVRFSLNNAMYEIDLSADNVSDFEKLLAPYIAAARRVDSERRADQAVADATTAHGREAIRGWAARNGVIVAPRGRIPHDVLMAYARRQ